MLSHVFKSLLGRRGRDEVDEDNDDDDGVPLNPTKKRKTSHTSSRNEDNAHNKTFGNELLLSTIASFLDYSSELNLAACCRLFYKHLSDRDERILERLVLATNDPTLCCSLMISRAMSTLRKHYGDDDNANDDQHPQTFWSWLRDAGQQVMSMRLLRGEEDFMQGRTLMPNRYVLHHSYTVPFHVCAGPQFGLSCSFVIANEEQTQQTQPRLAVITPSGRVLVFNVSNMQLHLACLTHKSIALLGYSVIFDKLWYCSNNKKGLLILQHWQHTLHEFLAVRVLDLACTDQYIGREAEFEELASSIDGARGIDQRIVTASEAFDEAWFSRVVVSSEHGLVFFVGNDTERGQICIKSYRVTSDNEQLVASIHHRVNTIRPRTRTHAVVTQDKLVVAYSYEEDVAGTLVPPLGLGIYIFNIQDLSFSHYIPMFQMELYFGDITPNWIAFHVPGTSHTKVVQITGGRVGH